MPSKPALPDAKIQGLLSRLAMAELPDPEERRAIRVKARVPIREAAEIMEVAPMTFLRWETGERRPRREHARKYRELLDALRPIAGQ